MIAAAAGPDFRRPVFFSGIAVLDVAGTQPTAQTMGCPLPAARRDWHYAPHGRDT